jgi:GTP-binding protein Era
MSEDSSRCGLVALVGRPNVGKSTLLNHLLGQKISITSRKPQTTRHQILGVKTTAGVQAIFVDTPGLHRHEERAINRYMNRAARSALADVDVVVMLVDRDNWSESDQHVLDAVMKAGKPAILAINKIDLMEDKDKLLPFMQDLSERGGFTAMVPLSALRGRHLQQLEAEIHTLLPAAPPMFPDDQITDRSERFLVAEIVREKLTRQLGDELPYASTVLVEEFVEEGPRLNRIGIAILVEKAGQKGIVIGRGGQRLKRIGEEARLDMERLLDRKVMLNLWVRVKSGWSDDQRALKSLGYDERES